MKYKRSSEWLDCYPWTSADPGLFIFTVDQSVDMRVDYSGFKNRSEIAADLVNRSIYQIISTNYSGHAPRSRCYITVLGYAAQAKVLCEGWLMDLCESPKRIEQMRHKIPDGEGGLIDRDTVPIVINLTAGNNADRDIHNFELKGCLVCNVLCKSDKEISDGDRLYWKTHSSKHLPENVICRMRMDGYDISSLFLEPSMLDTFIRAPFYY